MSKHFITKVNDNQIFEISQDNISALDAIKTSKNKLHILHQNKSYKAEISECNFLEKSYTIEVNNNIYKVNISDGLDLLIKEMGFESTASKHINELKAPMPGLILEVYVEIEQDVKEGDPLLILEAMKMENIITSPRDGKIKSISAVKGDAVEKNYLLIEFE
ncbi:acetyl-CoA carboxylase biotin carboxyl carrier protein subunit [Algibacter sp. L4_22]|uniref:acetyl-CoA carboxylase biotin carboxyl carrier protein subunit n=1 Tax=Algibacter sp. L4_22 TaxID=2942477 RepID=UPI00201B8C5B|nr:acetyl-CoA carboxylase biotin carboxyl carrier protein subunit [Algibacter sp. L4_22]MCL5130364.1 acetyl-CoA carboxylase biotin carboxyl carrier protein subunit [Algibacter sp. L4_22]